ncbi:hypothetical protein QBC47DRAFT_364084 [Echria macrotheca]|uniref:Uncharacterized protein n=1 Tax=Echria macrotheca TaxID=438768 RepID=A0AAJ0B6N3_9PEZI|nr:hypothetical protein QBC47DRAFT_364084 [Echria macrotheca]
MASTFAVGGVGVDGGHGPHPAVLGAHHHNNNNTNSSSTAAAAAVKSFDSNNSIFDAHRQNHNSSKLPAFRFADLKKDAIVLPSLLQHIPPSPISPQPENPDDHPADGCPQQQHTQQLQRDAHDQAAAAQQIPGSLPNNLHNYATQTRQDKSPSPETQPRQLRSSPPITRASTLQTQTAGTTTKSDPPTGSKRPASFPDTPSSAANAYATRNQQSVAATPAVKRRLTASAVSTGADTLASSRIADAADDQNSTREWAQGQRELLLPKTIDTSKSDERRKSRPPVSYRPPNVTGGRAVIPPIRSFRSSGSRKSLVLDMHVRRTSEESYGEEITDPNQRDRTLRALEGRFDDDLSQITPPDSADPTGDDNTADLFMRIARDEPNQVEEQEKPAGDQGPIPVCLGWCRRLTCASQNEMSPKQSRLTRAAHRRPLSAAVPTYQATSPPQITRRLSDQRENTRARQPADPRSPQQITRELAYRTSVKEKPTVTTEDSGRSQTARTPLRPSPITPRQISFQDPPSETLSAYRRRQSVTESNTGYSSGRAPQYRNATFTVAQGRTYNSSPLVPKSIDLKHETQINNENHAVEGTESSASTAAPSTVWDELDDLKSRIHRLELTGKAPSTSGAAMSRVSDDRPPTATTNATTMSASPKRGTGAAVAQPDATSAASAHKESQPLLLSALSKTRGLVSAEVFEAIEAAANDALALTSMMGAPGQPGPISSGASTIGVGANVTDRQLRRKADSICRSLTELCIALADEVALPKPSQAASTARENVKDTLASPTVGKLAPTPTQRRPSALTESITSKPMLSPRAPTSLEQRRLSMLTSSTTASPRFAVAPSTPMEPLSAGRKTSLLLARTRRAGTEEPEESTGRKSSLLLRTRRAGTEEPEDNREGRKTSLLVRTRKATNEDDDEGRFRAPSRAITEVNSFRSPREIGKNPVAPPDDNSLGSSALPRRRLAASSLNPRLVAPSVSTQAAPTTPNRRYLVDRPAPERETNSMVEKLAEERGQRQFSLSQTAMLNRTGSTSRRVRDSAIPNLGQNTTSGGYR